MYSWRVYEWLYIQTTASTKCPLNKIKIYNKASNAKEKELKVDIHITIPTLELMRQSLYYAHDRIFGKTSCWNKFPFEIENSWIRRKICFFSLFFSSFQISESMFFGDIQVQTENETLAPDYSTRTMKVNISLRLKGPSHEICRLCKWFTTHMDWSFLRCTISLAKWAKSIKK